MFYLFPIFALLVMAAGWQYMFFSRAAERLATFEGDELNRRRVRLRRFNGAIMFVLGIDVLAAYVIYGDRKPTVNELMLWVAAMVMLFVIVLLALIDVRLTARLRKRKREAP